MAGWAIRGTMIVAGGVLYFLSSTDEQEKEATEAE